MLILRLTSIPPKPCVLGDFADKPTATTPVLCRVLEEVVIYVKAFTARLNDHLASAEPGVKLPRLS
ncbi:MAG: hypothetical protein ACKPH7_13935, partial [Planktothrix sp.]|uniref:hypothetical protein n=1 Tax=Planktothrix sp. TaxID=3088171 RepID=UPI0038D3EBD0